jgi:hypothetical protein
MARGAVIRGEREAGSRQWLLSGRQNEIPDQLAVADAWVPSNSDRAAWALTILRQSAPAEASSAPPVE